MNQHTIARAVVVTLCLSGAVALFLPGPDSANASQATMAAQLAAETVLGLPPAGSGFSTSVTCSPNVSWNPDAGLGLVRCGATDGGYTTVNIESESTTAVYFFYRSVSNPVTGASTVTKANYTTVGKKRCVGCNNGAAYQAEIGNADKNLFCVATSSTDAGVVLSVECAR